MTAPDPASDKSDDTSGDGHRRRAAVADADRGFASRYRFVVWGVTWLSYASYYVGRKGLSVSKKTMQDQLGVSSYAFASIETAYLSAYAVGQFVNGLLGDRLGARRLVSLGMLLSAVCVGVFGSVSTGLLLGILFTLNGFAQSSGWPGNNRAMAEWTSPRSRGTVMAFWATCYMVGSIAANFLCSRLLGMYGWRAAFHGPAIWLLVVAGLVFVLVKSGPGSRILAAKTADPLCASSAGDAAVPTQAKAATGGEAKPNVKVAGDPESALADTRAAARGALLRSRTIWCFGGSYFCIKLIRYSLLFWLPFYLSKRLGYDALTASDVASAFEAGGIAGVIGIGLLSDRVRFNRPTLSAISLVGLALALLLYSRLQGPSVALNVGMFALVGALLYGPDSLLSGAAAQDAAGPHAAATATGFVNGIGSIGAIAQGYVTATVSVRYGWDKLFVVFVALALLGALALGPTLRRAEARSEG